MSVDIALAFMRGCTTQRDASGASLQWDTTTLSGLHTFAAQPGRFTAVLPVTPEVANRYGTLHGGCIATLVDTVGSAALVTVSPKGGVSLSITTTYLSKAPLGGSVLVEAQVVKVGRTIGVIDVKLTDQASGVVVAQGTHVKFISQEEPTMEELIAQQREEHEKRLQQEQAGQTTRQQQAAQRGPRSKL